MASNKGISEEKFNDVKVVVSEWYKRHNLVSMLKVVFKDHLANNTLSNAKRPIEIFNLLYAAGHLSRNDLTLLYETIELTEQKGLEEKIKEMLPSIQNIMPIDVDRPFSRFSAYRQKVVMFGCELNNEDIQAIDDKFNTPNINYVDSWSMITDLEHRQIICEKQIEEFKGNLKMLKLDEANKVFEEDITTNRKRKIQTQEEGPKEKERKVEQSTEGPINANPGKSLQSDAESSLRSDASVRMSAKNRGYIMLSYNHEHQEVVKRIRDRLREVNHKVWIDIEKMTGYVKLTMKKAVKDAGIVLICLSKKYEKSRNCKFECDRIQEFNKPFIPLIMDDFDKTNSWIEELIEDRVYVSFKDEAKFEESFTQLQNQLNGIKLDQEVQHPHPNAPLPSSVQRASQPTTSSDQLQASSSGQQAVQVKEPKFTKMTNDISKNILQDLNIWKVALKDYIMDTSVLEAKSAKLLLDELKRCSLLKIDDVSILLEAIKLTGSLHLQKYIPKNCPPLENIKITRFTKFRQSVIAFGMQLDRDAVGTIAASYSTGSDSQINPHYNDKWLLIMDLEKSTILKDDASLANFKSYLVDLGLQVLSQLLECSG